MAEGDSVQALKERYNRLVQNGKNTEGTGVLRRIKRAKRHSREVTRRSKHRLPWCIALLYSLDAPRKHSAHRQYDGALPTLRKRKEVPRPLLSMLLIMMPATATYRLAFFLQCP